MAQVEQLVLRRDPTSAPYVVLRAQIAAARKEAGLTQQALADRLGKPQSFVAKVERGERFLDVVEFVSIARATGLDVEKVLAAVVAEI